MMIGIDFGTCFSTAAVMSGQIPVTNLIKDNREGVPSLFMYSSVQGKELYGEQCITAEASRHPGDVVRYMKRTVRENPGNLSMTVTSGGREYTMDAIIEKYLAYLISEVRTAAMKSGEFKNNDIEAITITAPVGIAKDAMMASEYNRMLQDAVSRIAHISKERVKVLQEPVAAAISYLYSEDIRHHYDSKQTVMVFDLGGGTLDVTVVEHDPRTMTYRILAKEGDLNLGGNDWDAALGEAVLQKIGIEKDGTSEEIDFFDRAVTNLKIDLTSVEEGMICFPMGGDDRLCRFSRQEFEDCTEPLLRRAIGVVDKVIDSLEGGLESIDKFVLVGGSSNMPQILNEISAEYAEISHAEILVYEPSKAIAKGAAIFAKMTSAVNGSQMGGKVLDCATHTYGFETLKHDGGSAIYNMIYKSTQFDEFGMIRVASDTNFIPVYDDQTVVAFNIYESEHPKGDSNWFDFGQDEVFNGLRCTVQVPPEFYGRAKGFKMWVDLALDDNGILEITVRDRAGNRLAFASSSMAGE